MAFTIFMGIDDKRFYFDYVAIIKCGKYIYRNTGVLNTTNEIPNEQIYRLVVYISNHFIIGFEYYRYIHIQQIYNQWIDCVIFG